MSSSYIDESTGLWNHSEFELRPRHYVDFRKNTLWKGMDPLIFLAMG